MNERTPKILQEGATQKQHTEGWNTSQAKATQDLEHMATQEIALAEAQAEAFARDDQTIGAKAFASLLVLYPNHPHAEHWKARKTELENA